MLNFLKNIIKPKYETLNHIEINRDNILHNFSLLSEEAESQIIPVLKSNAYGHGLKELCIILNDSDAKMVAVDSFPEMQIALKYFKGKVLILGDMPNKTYSYCSLKRVEFCVYNQDSLLSLANIGKAKIHLFVNSGMNREGVSDVKEFVKKNLSILRKLDVVGFCSHLASADEDSKLNEIQLNKFLSDLDILESFGFKPNIIHLGNSAAIFSIKNNRLNAFRSGLALYGYSPFSAGSAFFNLSSKLKPALRVLSKVVSLQNIPEKAKVSYNETYTATHNLRIAVFPFGYYEGLDRRFSNKAFFKAQGNHYFQVAGRVCMNLCCLEDKNSVLKINDEVEIISWNSNDKNSVTNLSSMVNILSYELLVKLQSNIRRKIV